MSNQTPTPLLLAGLVKPPLPPEGWQAERPEGQRISHYFRGAFSVCNRLARYDGPLVPDGLRGGLPLEVAIEACSECVRRVQKAVADEEVSK